MEERYRISSATATGCKAKPLQSWICRKNNRNLATQRDRLTSIASRECKALNFIVRISFGDTRHPSSDKKGSNAYGGTTKIALHMWLVVNPEFYQSLYTKKGFGNDRISVWWINEELFQPTACCFHDGVRYLESDLLNTNTCFIITSMPIVP